MAGFTWIASTAVNPTNLNKMLQTGHFTPGSSTFNGSTGREIAHSLGHTNFTLFWTPTADPEGGLGEVWITKASDKVTIHNSGAATTAFDYVLLDGTDTS